jgi:2,2-dialkylglycine decarboxylase (pyruvate)
MSPLTRLDGMTQGAAAATFSAGRKGYGPTAPGQLVLPTPNAFRSPFRKPDGWHDWKAELDFGWGLIDCGSHSPRSPVIC